MTITPRLIFWHNLRVLGRVVLSFAGAFVVWLLQSLFLWALCSIVLGWTELTSRVFFVCVGVPSGLLVRSLCKMQLGQRSWRESLPRYETEFGLSSVRLMARAVDLSDGAGGAVVALALSAAPRMVRAAIDDLKELIYPTKNESEQLERVRENLAARDSWELLRDFKTREPEIRKLAALGLVTVRKISGIWSLRISLRGQRS